MRLPNTLLFIVKTHNKKKVIALKGFSFVEENIHIRGRYNHYNLNDVQLLLCIKQLKLKDKIYFNKIV
jgi:hypothetical protein